MAKIRRRYTKRTVQQPNSAAGGKKTVTTPSTPVRQEPGFPMTEEEVNDTRVVEPHSYVMEKYPRLNDSEAMLVHVADKQYEDAKQKYDALKGNPYRDYISQYTKDETDEEKAAREARDKKSMRWAAIADGISALANIGGAMGGATPIQPSKTLSGAQAERMEYARKIRDARRKLQEKQYSDALKRWEKETEAARKEMLAAERNLGRTTSSALTMSTNRKYKEGLLENQNKRTEIYERSVDNQNTNRNSRTQNLNKNNDSSTSNQNKNRDERTAAAWYKAKHPTTSSSRKSTKDEEARKNVLGGLRA